MATNNAEIDDKKYIDQLLANGERVTLECKRARKDVPHSLWETYSAFANTDGGTILLGVDEDLKEKDISKRFNIIGVEDAAKIRTDIWNTPNSREKVPFHTTVKILSLFMCLVPIMKCVRYISTTTLCVALTDADMREIIIVLSQL